MKYYAVRKGHKPGVYTNWPECEQQVKGFSGAEYKSFKTENEALDYINGVNNIIKNTDENETIDTITNTNTSNDNTFNYPLAFVDGSFNIHTNVYGYGGFVAINQTNSIRISGHGNDPEMASMRNVAGEILGAMNAIQIALDNNLKTLDIYYDYEGISKWASGEWKRKNKYTTNYHEFIQKCKDRITLNFIKVEAHTGVPGNELADRIAKRAVGLLPENNEDI